VYGDVTEEYEQEREDLEAATRRLYREHPEIRRTALLSGERQVLRREKSAILDAVREGVVSDDVGERLLEEAAVKIERVDSGESTVSTADEGYEEFWRHRVDEFGLDIDGDEADEDDGEAGAQ
jgi:CPA1 family monovalent cation:H+ antiporter